LKDFAKKLKNNDLENVRFELVCIISYEENGNKSGPSELEIKSAIKKIVDDRFSEFDAKGFSAHNSYVLDRLHIFAVPVWDLEQLMGMFE
jgi:hypothetical protein